MSTHRRQAFVALRLSGARPVPGLMDGIVSTTEARRVIR